MTQESTPTLEPCPLCQSPAELQYHCGTRYVECSNNECGNQSNLFWTDEEAVTDWNTRRTQPASQSDEALKEALLQHNDLLRSACSIADRDGRDTNWLTFRGACHYTLAEHHDLVTKVRANLNPDCSEFRADKSEKFSQSDEALVDYTPDEIEFIQQLMDRYSEDGGYIDLGLDHPQFMRIVRRYVTDRIASARAEGRREGIEEAATAIENRWRFSKASAVVIRALAEKQP